MHTHSTFNQLSTLIAERTGLAVHTQLKDALYEILLAMGDLTGLYEQLQSSRETDPIWQQLITALTIGETYFLRDRAHFHLLKTHILPQIIEKRRRQGTLFLNIWSIGCATGEEPYSIAITLHELLPDLDQWEIKIFGTDLNGQALHTARRGVYRKWAFRHTDLDFQGTYFDPVGDGLLLKTQFQNMVTFRHANLFSAPPVSHFDLILCRNVLIYFSTEHTRKAEDLLFHTLSPDGWLLLGSSETIRNQRDRWVIHLYPNSPAYQKPGQPVKTATGEFARSHVLSTQTVKAVRLEETDPARLYEKASHALQQEDYDRAEAVLDQLIRSHPDHAAAHTLLAYVCANRNKASAAQEQLEIALDLDPLQANAHYLRAVLYIEHNQPEAALEALRSALYCQHNHPLASYMIGNIYAQNGELIKAQRHWENVRRAISTLKPDSPVSDISNTTAGQLMALVTSQLNGWQ